MLEQRETQLRIEAQRHSSALSNRDPDGMRVKASRFQFAQEVVLKELAPIGIEASRRRVSKGGVIAFKTVSPSFSLAFSLGEVDLFFRDSKGGLLILHLTLRTPEGLQGPGPGRTYLVRYQELVEGLATAYLAFSDLETLQTHIKAQLHLFRMVEPRLTAAIRSAE
jgi:hypothetical protein